MSFVLCGALAGCTSLEKPKEPKHNTIAPGTPLPELGEVVRRYNARVEKLWRLSTPVTLVIDAPKEAGSNERRTDQVEGSLQIIQPERVSLRIDKVGQTLFTFGANEQSYWWIDTGHKGDKAVAYVGSMQRADPRVVERFAIPIHPLDLLHVLCITPVGEGARIAWDTTTGQLRLMEATRWGARAMLLDPNTLEPSACTLLDSEGRPAVTVALSKFRSVPIDGDAFADARMASTIRAFVPRVDARIDFFVVDPKNPGERMRTKPFELERLIESYGVRERVDLDAQARTP